MFTTEKMHYLKLYLPRKNLDNFVNMLFEKGICQIEESAFNYKYLREDSLVRQAKSQIEIALSDLDHYHKSNPISMLKTLFSSTPPKRTLIKSEDDIDILDSINDKVVSIVPIIADKIASIKEKEEEISKNLDQIKVLRVLPDVKTKELLSSNMIGVQIGLCQTVLKM